MLPSRQLVVPRRVAKLRQPLSLARASVRRPLPLGLVLLVGVVTRFPLLGLRRLALHKQSLLTRLLVVVVALVAQRALSLHAWLLVVLPLVVVRRAGQLAIAQLLFGQPVEQVLLLRRPLAEPL